MGDYIWRQKKEAKQNQRRKKNLQNDSKYVKARKLNTDPYFVKSVKNFPKSTKSLNTAFFLGIRMEKLWNILLNISMLSMLTTPTIP